MGPKNHTKRGSRSPYAKGQFLGERTCPGLPEDTAFSCAKMAKPIQMPFGLWIRVGPRRHVLRWVHSGATCWMQLHQSCAAAMRPSNYFNHLLLGRIAVQTVYKSTFLLTMYVDAAYRPSGVLSRSVTDVSHAKTAELIQMQFSFWTWMGRINHVLDRVQIPHSNRQFWDGNGMSGHARRHSDVSCAKTAELIDMPFELWTRGGSTKACYRGAH